MVPNRGYYIHRVLMSGVLVVIVSSRCLVRALFSKDLFSVIALMISFLLVTVHTDPGGRCLRLGSEFTRLLGLPVRIPSGTWLAVSCECCVLSGRLLCVGPITQREESYLVWCVLSVCDCEASIMRRPWHTKSCWAMKENIIIAFSF
jgi:hypothetical protein